MTSVRRGRIPTSIARRCLAAALAAALAGLAACANGPNAASIDRCENFKSWDDASQPGNCY
jgi:hypothetical protein